MSEKALPEKLEADTPETDAPGVSATKAVHADPTQESVGVNVIQNPLQVPHQPKLPV